MSVGRADPAPVTDDFSQNLAARGIEAIKRFELSRAFALVGRQVLDHDRAFADHLRLRTKTIFQQTTERSARAVDDENRRFLEWSCVKRRGVISAAGMCEVMRNR